MLLPGDEVIGSVALRSSSLSVIFAPFLDLDKQNSRYLRSGGKSEGAPTNGYANDAISYNYQQNKSNITIWWPSNNMNNAAKEEQDLNVCANCGIAGVDDIELEECTDCQSVRYCGDKCREEHRRKHEEECKIRAKESHDKKLFIQPDETHLGECPLCFLPMPLEAQKSLFKSCCSKIVCKGCNYADRKSGGGHTCPFCRESLPDDKEYERRLVKRIEASDPAALSKMGGERYDKGDYDGAFDYFTKAAKLGDSEAHYQLARMYHEEERVEKNMKKGSLSFGAGCHWGSSLR